MQQSPGDKRGKVFVLVEGVLDPYWTLVDNVAFGGRREGEHHMLQIAEFLGQKDRRKVGP